VTLEVERKPGETRTAFCATVMNITLEADKQTKGKSYSAPHSSNADGSGRVARRLRSCTLAQLHTRNAGLNFVWGTEDVQNHISYEILGSLSSISECSCSVACDPCADVSKHLGTLEPLNSRQYLSPKRREPFK
jgi:hypothetical protein